MLDTEPAPTPFWCWRDDWRVGGESSYCLLGLIQALNVVSNKTLIREFFEPVRRDDGRLTKYHKVDLRSADTLRVARLSRAIRQPVKEVVQSFVYHSFSNGGKRSYAWLRWCPTCIKAGYHSNIFQMPLTQACPAHGNTLEDHCRRCRTRIPYRLDPAVAAPLFACPNCNLDLIPRLRAGWRKPPFDLIVLAKLDQRVKLMQFCDQLPMLASRFINTASLTPQSNFLVASPSACETVAAYSTFVTGVMSALAAMQQVDWQHPTDACRFSEVTPPRCRGQTIVRAKPGWPSHLLPTSDIRLSLAASVYRCVRRHVWRKVVRHQRCFISLAKHCWWSLRGTQTSTVCPVATAFLRWRMQWESVSVASMPLSRPTVAPLGLVSWLAASAPLGAATWTAKVDDWLMAEVLGRDLLGQFNAMLNEELRRPNTAQVSWAPLPVHALSDTCWVCVGRGTSSSPARLFVRLDPDATEQRLGPTVPGHFREHLARLSQIVH